MDELRLILPWAEYAAPLVGENTSGRYNKSRNAGSISDTNDVNTFTPNSTNSSLGLSVKNTTVVSTSANIPPSQLKTSKYAQNTDDIGEKPANKYDIELYRVNDAFTDPATSNVNRVNKYAYNYTPESCSNGAKGSFAVPAVGSHVWCFFTHGNPNDPVYFAASYSQSDWQSIYGTDGLDYPGDFENKSLSGGNYTVDTDSYRNKYVVNQKGGSIQINNSDKRESIKFSHFSGSFKEFTNIVNIELAVENDQKLVMGDAFYTIKGTNNTYIEGESDNIIRGDQYIKIGNLRADLAKQWYDLTRDIANTKQLFDIQRAVNLVRNGLQLTSSNQTRSGGYAKCPVCAGNETFYWKLNNQASKVNLAVCSSEGGGPYFENTVTKMGMQGLAEWGTFRQNGTIFGGTCPACGGSGVSPSSMDGNWNKEPIKEQLGVLITGKTAQLTAIEQQMGLGGSQIIDITKHKYETIGLVMNDSSSIRVDATGKMYNSNVVINPQGVFVNRAATPLIEYVQVDDLPGGNYTLNICNKYSVQVGAGGINLKSFGPVNITGSITNIAGEQVNIGSSNEVNIDGGNRLNIVADIVSIKQREKQQVLIDSCLGVNKNLVVGGGAHIEGELTVNHITAPTEIQQTEGTVVLGRPASIGGGLIGAKIGSAANLWSAEIYNPISQTDTSTGVPAYVGAADPAIMVGWILPGTLLGIGNLGNPVTASAPIPIFGSGIPSIRGVYFGYAGSPLMGTRVYGTGADDDSIVMSPHSHNFKNLPLTLTDNHEEVRARANANNTSVRNQADSINNSKK